MVLENRTAVPFINDVSDIFDFHVSLNFLPLISSNQKAKVHLFGSMISVLPKNRTLAFYLDLIRDKNSMKYEN